MRIQGIILFVAAAMTIGGFANGYVVGQRMHVCADAEAGVRRGR